jgi:GNAT superfamily N-acetyltransferase
MVLKVEALTRQHIRRGFACGRESLDSYIQKQASQDLKRRVATAFVLIDEPDLEILAYYTLSAYTIEVTALDQSFAKQLPRYPRLPATLLGRLAADRRYRGQRLGEFMLVDALRKALEVSVQVASLAVIAEALDEEAARFYIKYGFQAFQQQPLKFYLPMKSVAQLFEIP